MTMSSSSNIIPKKRPPSSAASTCQPNSTKLYLFQDLYKQGLYDSCHFLMNLEKKDDYFQSSSENILYADLLVKKNQILYSLRYYERGMILIQAENLQSPWAVAAADRYLEKCLEAGEMYKAKQFIESSRDAHEEKSIKRLRQKACVYDFFGEIKNAIEVYKAIVKLQPMAIEAIESLVNYGCSMKELKALDISDPIISKFTNGLSLSQTGSFTPSMECFKSILPGNGGNNVQILALLAHTQRRSGEVISAIHTFAKIRRLDPFWIQGMDHFASLLKTQGNISAVQKLSIDMFSLAKDSPEAWVILAVLNVMKGNTNTALNHLEKAILLRNRHALAHQLKGQILLSSKNHGEASVSFRTAYRISRDISNYEGLVHCYIAMGKSMEATSTAKEALTLLPQCARAVCLAGLVMKESPSLITKAREYLEKALKMDPKAIEPVFALAELYTKQDDIVKAIKILEDHVSIHHTESIHVRLGDLYLQKTEYQMASQHYNSALSINPECMTAKQGLADVERMVNGGDNEGELESEEEAEEEE